MARSLRIERENGVYHVINRRNYRQDLFVNEGAHRSFENCLFEACEKSAWVLEGLCVMTNHGWSVLAHNLWWIARVVRENRDAEAAAA